MEKLKMQSHDVIGSNTQKIAQLFPNCVTERLGKDGKSELAIDFEKLQAELSNEIIAEGEERYQFTWPDKRAAVRLANTPTTMTLRPCREESVDFDNTQNLYIEGDNLDVLKCLKETYLHKVKMIYIDPPYNTGNDFVYNDDFGKDKGSFEETSGLFDEDGNQTIDPMQRNTESNGRFHTDWLNMIYPRLKVARDLLTDDGAIFISIDDYEEDNLKKICNEIFGERNFVACVAWQRNYAPISLKKFFSESHEYCYIYAKDLNQFQMNLLPRSDKQNKDYKNPDNDPRGVWKVGNLTVGPAVEKQVYEIVGPTGRKFLPPSGYCWRFTKEKFEEMRKDNRIWFGTDGNNSPVPKLFLTEVQDGVTPMTLWSFEEAGHNQIATRELREIFGASIFTSPKPLKYLTRYLQIGLNKDSLILDFFSGSATTAHAVMKLNAEDGGNRKFIMVQLPEKTDEKSEAYKAGYKNICEIGKERIRRAGKKIKEEAGLMGQSLDIGFRVLKLDESNMADVYYTPAETPIQQTLALDVLVNNIREGRTPEDLLFQVMPECNLPLSSKIEEREMHGKKVFVVNDGYLIACFDTDINEAVITAIAKEKPYYFVMRDSSMATDNVADNFDQIFNAYSKDTVRRIL